MKILIVILLLYYLIILQLIFGVWLKLFKQERNLSVDEKQISWIIIIGGAALWPLVVPIAYLSLLEKKWQEKSLSLMNIKPMNKHYPN